jgi:hypothetical protein
MIILLASASTFAQKQGNIWYFGNKIGMDFNTVPPTFLDTSAMGNSNVCGESHIEGTASIADSTGQLLFYTNGKKVWNRIHEVMQSGSGLLGGTSSTQSSLIVPQPNSQTKFYLFTTDDFCNELANGFRYSVIDMCQAGGLGKVISSNKNILLLDTVAEKIAATRHANGIDYWVVTHKYFSNEFYAFLLTEDGISDTVVSSVGSVHGVDPNDMSDAIGQLKISPIGNWLAVSATNGANILDLFRFSDETGEVSGYINLNGTENYGSYGIAFSQDGSKFYGGYFIDQWDLSSGNSQEIVASRVRIGSENYGHNGFQLGPDGKIYIVRPLESFLDVIHSPNELGVDCNLEEEGYDLHGVETVYTVPSFIDSYDYGTAGDCSLGNSIQEGERLEFLLYPNPVNEYLHVSAEFSAEVSIHDIQSREVLRLDCDGKCSFDVSKLEAGIYTVQYSSQIGLGVRSFVKN